MHDERFAEGKEFSWQTACKRLCVSLPCTCVFTFERVWAQEPCPALLLSSVQPVAKTRSAAGFWLLALDRFFQSLAIWVEEDHVGKSRGLWKVKQTPHVNREKAEPAPSIWFNWLFFQAPMDLWPDQWKIKTNHRATTVTSLQIQNHMRNSEIPMSTPHDAQFRGDDPRRIR